MLRIADRLGVLEERLSEYSTLQAGCTLRLAVSYGVVTWRESPIGTLLLHCVLQSVDILTRKEPTNQKHLSIRLHEERPYT